MSLLELRAKAALVVMRAVRAPVAVAVTCMLALSSRGETQQTNPAQSEADAVTTTVRALFSAAERGDLVALDTLYAGDSLTIIEGAGINRGWSDYRDHHLAPELKEMKNFIYRPSEIVAHPAGNIAWAIFRYALKADVEGRSIDNVGRGTAILERRGQKWVIRHTQTTSRARRPTDPPMAP